MKPITRAASLVLVVLFAATWFFINKLTSPKVVVDGYKNISYIIDGTTVVLTDGVSEVPAAPDSASKVTTRYFGNLAQGDLNADGIADVAFILTQNSGGSGIFYYVVAALQNSGGGYSGTSAVLIGDRIAPQTTEIADGKITVNYADRAPSEEMTTQPSVGVSKEFRISDTTLIELPRIASEGQHCGGNMSNAPACDPFSHCAPIPGSSLPFGDVGGICVKN